MRKAPPWSYSVESDKQEAAFDALSTYVWDVWSDLDEENLERPRKDGEVIRGTHRWERSEAVGIACAKTGNFRELARLVIEAPETLSVEARKLISSRLIGEFKATGGGILKSERDKEEDDPLISLAMFAEDISGILKQAYPGRPIDDLRFEACKIVLRDLWEPGADLSPNKLLARVKLSPNNPRRLRSDRLRRAKETPSSEGK